MVIGYDWICYGQIGDSYRFRANLDRNQTSYLMISLDFQAVSNSESQTLEHTSPDPHQIAVTQNWVLFFSSSLILSPCYFSFPCLYEKIITWGSYCFLKEGPPYHLRKWRHCRFLDSVAGQPRIWFSYGFVVHLKIGFAFVHYFLNFSF